MHHPPPPQIHDNPYGQHIVIAFLLFTLCLYLIPAIYQLICKKPNESDSPATPTSGDTNRK